MDKPTSILREYRIGGYIVLFERESYEGDDALHVTIYHRNYQELMQDALAWETYSYEDDVDYDRYISLIIESAIRNMQNEIERLESLKSDNYLTGLHHG